QARISRADLRQRQRTARLGRLCGAQGLQAERARACAHPAERQTQGGDGDAMSEQRTAIETVAMTLYGEARGQSLLDRLAVGAVIRERVLRPGWWGKDWQGVCTAPWQFTAWHSHDNVH